MLYDCKRSGKGKCAAAGAISVSDMRAPVDWSTEAIVHVYRFTIWPNKR